MSNDGFRVTIDRRGGRFYWTLNDRGEQHEGKRGYDSIIEAATEANTYRSHVNLFKEKRGARTAEI